MNIGDNHSVYGGLRELILDIALLFYFLLSTLFLERKKGGGNGRFLWIRC